MRPRPRLSLNWPQGLGPPAGKAGAPWRDAGRAGFTGVWRLRGTRGWAGCTGRPGHAVPPAAAGPLGLAAQPRAPAGPAVRRPLALLRPPRREPPLPPVPRPLPGGAERHPRGRGGRLHAAGLLGAPPHRRVSRAPSPAAGGEGGPTSGIRGPGGPAQGPRILPGPHAILG